jgi:carboxymethylenebutenolidase
MQLELTAADGHKLSAYRADAKGTAKGGLVVIQEIFGVNDHIRSVCDRYAADGYTCLAPALFDRVGPDIQLGYEADDIAKGREIRGKVADDDALKDIAAAIAALNADGLSTAVVGYCWGGSLTWLTATRLSGVKAAISYYGGQVPDQADEQPKVPVLFHFGETDASIPLDKVEIVRAKHPDLPLHIYPAGHGFSCDARGSFDAESAELAKSRTLAFLSTHI